MKQPRYMSKMFWWNWWVIDTHQTIGGSGRAICMCTTEAESLLIVNALNTMESANTANNYAMFQLPKFEEIMEEHNNHREDYTSIPFFQGMKWMYDFISSRQQKHS